LEDIVHKSRSKWFWNGGIRYWVKNIFLAKAASTQHRMEKMAAVTVKIVDNLGVYGDMIVYLAYFIV
jgi:hypothetical protein